MATKTATAEKAATTSFHAEGFLASLEYQINAMVDKWWPSDMDLTPVILRLRSYADELEEVRARAMAKEVIDTLIESGDIVRLPGNRIARTSPKARAKKAKNTNPKYKSQDDPTLPF
jgi:hypothetical protein